MTMAIPLSYSLRNLAARKLTTALTAGGMALVVFVFAAVLMLDEGLRTTLVATVPVQDDADGTQLVFSNGSVSVKVAATGMTLGGATVPSAAAAAVTPTTIDATVTSGSGSSTGSSNGTYTVTSDMDTVVEGKTATFTVTRSGDVTAAKTLTFNASGDTNNTTVAAAAAGVDASPASGTVTFAAGATTATFTVSAAADTAVEGLEGLRVRLFDGTTAVADKVVLINDDTTGTTVPGNTFTLTTGADNITGTSGNDTVSGVSSATAGESTLNLADVVDGGAGTDTLKLILEDTDGTQLETSCTRVAVVWQGKEINDRQQELDELNLQIEQTPLEKRILRAVEFHEDKDNKTYSIVAKKSKEVLIIKK